MRDYCGFNTGLRSRHGLAVQAEASREVEGAPLAHLALDPDAPTHQLDQPRGDGQPQPRAAEPPGGRGVGLGERLEDQPLLLRRDADARVPDGEVQDAGVRSQGAGVRSQVAGWTGLLTEP